LQRVEHLPIAASDEIELIEIGGRATRQQRQIKRKCLPHMRERERSAAPAKTVMLVGPLAVGRFRRLSDEVSFVLPLGVAPAPPRSSILGKTILQETDSFQIDDLRMSACPVG
jgi:hypothetical protein